MENPRIWQCEIVAEAVAAGKIDESQALLLGILYFKANWSTGVINDFRAERACEWLGHDFNYARTMRKRLKALRELGWFRWTYRKGEKIPYDITMRLEDAGGRTESSDDRHGVTVTGSAVDCESPSMSEPLTSREVVAVQAGVTARPSAPPSSLVLQLRAEVYEHAKGELIDRVLCPDQMATLLAEHSLEEIVYAIGKRCETVTVKREFHRSFKTFLLSGIQLELDAARLKLKDGLENCRKRLKTPYQYIGMNKKVITVDPVKGAAEWIAEHADEFNLFLEIGYDAAALVYSVPAVEQRREMVA
jgi:hypothetical protein